MNALVVTLLVALFCIACVSLGYVIRLVMMWEAYRDWQHGMDEIRMNRSNGLSIDIENAKNQVLKALREEKGEE